MNARRRPWGAIASTASSRIWAEARRLPWTCSGQATQVNVAPISPAPPVMVSIFKWSFATETKSRSSFKKTGDGATLPRSTSTIASSFFARGSLLYRPRASRAVSHRRWQALASLSDRVGQRRLVIEGAGIKLANRLFARLNCVIYQTRLTDVSACKNFGVFAVP
jgi:hypothetical protein